MILSDRFPKKRFGLLVAPPRATPGAANTTSFEPPPTPPPRRRRRWEPPGKARAVPAARPPLYPAQSPPRRGWWAGGSARWRSQPRRWRCFLESGGGSARGCLFMAPLERRDGQSWRPGSDGPDLGQGGSACSLRRRLLCARGGGAVQSRWIAAAMPTCSSVAAGTLRARSGPGQA
jgi:hypothetical protein